MSEQSPILRYKIEHNRQPLDLLDVATAMTAIAEQFKIHAETHYGEKPDYRLSIHELRTGSLIADLVEYTKQALMVAETVKPIFSFANMLKDFYIAVQGGQRQFPELTGQDFQQRSAILDPVAKDAQSSLSIQMLNVQDGGTVIFNLNSSETNAIQNSIRRITNESKLPESTVYKHKLLTLYQGRNADKSTAGNMGRIEGIGHNRPHKLLFASDVVRDAIIKTEGNPLTSLVFEVDVNVVAIDGKPQFYKILCVHDVMRR